MRTVPSVPSVHDPVCFAQLEPRLLLDGTPIVVNPIDDVAVNEDAPATALDLSGVFEDPDGGASETWITFDPGFGPSTTPVTYEGVTFTSLIGGVSIRADRVWSSLFDNIPDSSQGKALEYSYNATDLRIDLPAPVSSVSLLLSTGPIAATWGLTAYDGGGNAVDSETAVMPAAGDAVLAGLASTGGIAWIKIEGDWNDNITLIDDLRFETTAPGPLTLSVAGNTNPGLVTAGFGSTDLTLSYAPDQYGTADITIRATDADDLWVEDTFTVTVKNLVDLSGRVFDDRDNDGVFDPGDGDNGLEVEVELANGSGVVATATTAADGTYDFQNLAEGTYTVRQQAQPAGYLDGLESTGNLGGDPGNNGTTVDNADSNEITGIVITAPGTQLDSGGYDFAELLPASVQGLVWEDFNDDGEVDLGELAIEGATITLTGTDDRGGEVNLSQATDSRGIFEIIDLRPGTYTVTESQPTGFVDGQENLGEVVELPPGVVTGNDGAIDPAGDAFSGIGLVAGSSGVRYNFAERVDGGGVHEGQAATIGFWQNKHGQDLIRSLNGDPDSTVLADWLADTFPNMYGDLAGTTNTDVAEFYRELFRRKGKTAPDGPPKLDAQVLAVALATFVTKQSLAGLVYDGSGQTSENFLFTDVDGDGVYEPTDGDSATIDALLIADIEAYGFDVTAGGLGSAFFNVGTSDEAFDGYEEGQDVQVIDLLLATNAMSVNGVLYDLSGDGAIDSSEALLRSLANEVYSAINEQGDI